MLQVAWTLHTDLFFSLFFLPIPITWNGGIPTQSACVQNTVCGNHSPSPKEWCWDPHQPHSATSTLVLGEAKCEDCHQVLRGVVWLFYTSCFAEHHTSSGSAGLTWAWYRRSCSCIRSQELLWPCRGETTGKRSIFFCGKTVLGSLPCAGKQEGPHIALPALQQPAGAAFLAVVLGMMLKFWGTKCDSFGLLASNWVPHLCSPTQCWRNAWGTKAEQKARPKSEATDSFRKVLQNLPFKCLLHPENGRALKGNRSDPDVVQVGLFVCSCAQRSNLTTLAALLDGTAACTLLLHFLGELEGNVLINSFTLQLIT